MTTPAVIVRLAGGLGNQLFQYAFGRALAFRNNVPLVLDAVSGFSRDPYCRSFALGCYNIAQQHTKDSRDFSTLGGRLSRRLLEFQSARLPLEHRPYIVEPEIARWNPTISNMRVTRRTYFQGYWQHDAYFRDIRRILLEDLTLRHGLSDACLAIARRIPEGRGIAIHTRCLRHAAAGAAVEPRLDIDYGYYDRAVSAIRNLIPDPVFLIFSDNPTWTRENITFQGRCEFLAGGRSDYEDLWLMSQCRGFVIANSTFSWWGAWLSQNRDKHVIAPRSALGVGLESVPTDWHLA